MIDNSLSSGIIKEESNYDRDCLRWKWISKNEVSISITNNRLALYGVYVPSQFLEFFNFSLENKVIERDNRDNLFIPVFFKKKMYYFEIQHMEDHAYLAWYSTFRKRMIRKHPDAFEGIYDFFGDRYVTIKLDKSKLITNGHYYVDIVLSFRT